LTDSVTNVTTESLSFGTSSTITVVGRLAGASIRLERPLDGNDPNNDGIGAIVNDQPWFLIAQPGSTSVLELWRSVEDTRFLNEPCTPDVSACQDGLTCATSGNASEPRCVPAVAPGS
jgi:hypothetical protein